MPDSSKVTFKVGDKVWMTDSFKNLYSYGGNNLATHPFEKKITQVVQTKSGTLYQVKGGHFHESWIGVYVFVDKQEAQKVLNKRIAKRNEAVRKSLLKTQSNDQ